MPIVGASLPDAARQFCDHFNRVLSTTITQARLSPLYVRGNPFAMINFRRYGEAATATLSSRYGTLELYLQQWCGSIVRGGRHILRTEKYRYAISLTPEKEPLFRWEYERVPTPENKHPRHHVHLDTDVDLHGHMVSLKDLHIATGYLPFEELIRFCIVELGTPPLQTGWEEVLKESYQLFKAEFTQ